MKSMNTLVHTYVSGSSQKTTAGLALLALTLGGLLLASCGGSSSTSASLPASPVSQGSVVIFAGDAPTCDVTSLSMTIMGMTLTPSGGGSPVAVISASNPVTVDFASLMGTSMMLGSVNIPAGSYSQATVTLSSPQMGMYSSSTGGMGYGMMSSSLSASSITVTLNPPLQVSAGGTAGMMLDLNLLQSIETNNGSVTGTISPTFTGSGISGPDGIMMQGMATLSGIIQGVSTSSSNSNFTGSITLAQWMMGRTFSVNVNSQTSFQNASGLSELTAGTFVQIQAAVDGSGNLVASLVTVEGLTNAQQSTGGFMGMIPSVSRDAVGNATGFQMGMNEEFPDMQTMMGLFSLPQVTLVSGAPFQIQDPTANFAGLTFDPTSLGPGQMISVMGQITGGSSGGMMMGGGSGSLTASSVMLQIQPMLGTFQKVLAAGSDGKSGGFGMAPCSSVFGGASIPVLTSSNTTFKGMNGLNDVPAGTQLVVNGLLFWEPQLTNASGIQFTPPGWVFEATEVGKLQ